MKSKASIYFIFVTIALDAIGLGIVLPVLPDVIRRYVTDEASVSRYFGLFVATYASLQFLSSPVLGRFSDRFGRRPVLLLSLFGAAVDYVFMAFAPTLPLLFVGRVISGISGASFTVASAYIADLSDDSNRSKNFGVIGAGFGLGFIIGPALGGLLAHEGPQYPFLAAASFNFLNFLFGALMLPESLPPGKRRAFDRAAFNPLRSLQTIGKMRGLGMLAVCFFLVQLAGQTHPSMWTLFTEHRLGWGPKQVGISLAVVGILSAVSQGALTGPLVARFGDLRVAGYGMLGEAVAYFFFGFSSTSAMIYIILILSSVFWTAHPALQSLLSKGVPDNQQGEFQGGLMALMSITAILNPLVMTWLFSLTSDRNAGIYFPGSPYFFASLLFLSGCLLLFRWHRKPQIDLAR